jgi:hypothetical protein
MSYSVKTPTNKVAFDDQVRKFVEEPFVSKYSLKIKKRFDDVEASCALVVDKNMKSEVDVGFKYVSKKGDNSPITKFVIDHKGKVNLQTVSFDFLNGYKLSYNGKHHQSLYTLHYQKKELKGSMGVDISNSDLNFAFENNQLSLKGNFSKLGKRLNTIFDLPSTHDLRHKLFSQIEYFLKKKITICSRIAMVEDRTLKQKYNAWSIQYTSPIQTYSLFLQSLYPEVFKVLVTELFAKRYHYFGGICLYLSDPTSSTVLTSGNSNSSVSDGGILDNNTTTTLSSTLARSRLSNRIRNNSNNHSNNNNNSPVFLSQVLSNIGFTIGYSSIPMDMKLADTPSPHSNNNSNNSDNQNDHFIHELGLRQWFSTIIYQFQYSTLCSPSFLMNLRPEHSSSDPNHQSDNSNLIDNPFLLWWNEIGQFGRWTIGGKVIMNIYQGDWSSVWAIQWKEGKPQKTWNSLSKSTTNEEDEDNEKEEEEETNYTPTSRKHWPTNLLKLRFKLAKNMTPTIGFGVSSTRTDLPLSQYLLAGLTGMTIGAFFDLPMTRPNSLKHFRESCKVGFSINLE